MWVGGHWPFFGKTNWVLTLLWPSIFLSCIWSDWGPTQCFGIWHGLTFKFQRYAISWFQVDLCWSGQGAKDHWGHVSPSWIFDSYTCIPTDLKYISFMVLNIRASAPIVFAIIQIIQSHNPQKQYEVKNSQWISIWQLQCLHTGKVWT